jgi:rhamnosyl/mannosyltransferase
LQILHLYKDYYPIIGGIENHIKMLSEAQVTFGHDAQVLATNPGRQPREEAINGVRVFRTKRLATIASTPLSVELPFRLRKLDADIVHLHFPYPIGEISQFLFNRSRPYVITYHSDVINPKQKILLRIYNPMLKKVLNNAEMILATSENYIKSSKYLSPLAHLCEVVPLGIDPKPFFSAEPLIKLDDIPILLFIGRLRYYKGLDILLDALREIDAKLYVGGDGPMLPIWQRKTRELNLTEKVTYLGNISDEDLPRLYASADIFVLPANMRAEAFGTVLLEAMAAGLPCVTTELNTGTSYVVQDGISGYVITPNDPGKLIEAINKLIDNKSLRKEMGVAGRNRVIREFTLDHLLHRVNEVYSSILDTQN